MFVGYLTSFIVLLTCWGNKNEMFHKFGISCKFMKIHPISFDVGPLRFYLFI